jgi:hypothetical protein
MEMDQHLSGVLGGALAVGIDLGKFDAATPFDSKPCVVDGAFVDRVAVVGRAIATATGERVLRPLTSAAALLLRRAKPTSSSRRHSFTNSFKEYLP